MSWTAVAKKEYLENVRNAWVIVVTLAFLLLTLLASSFASANSFFSNPGAPGDARAAFADLVMTLQAVQSFSGFLIPILALVIAHGTIAGERESGSLGLLVSQPLSRGEILAGKWVGLWGVLATAILLGFGIGGLIILANTGAGSVGYQVLILFLMETLAWGAAWISLTLFLSVWFDRRGTAIAASIGAWFLYGRFVWNMLTLLLLVTVLGPRFEDVMSRNDFEAPGWLIITQLLNPNSVYDGLLTTTIDGFENIAGFVGKSLLPDLYTAYVFSLAMAAWIALPYVAANALFHRKDI